jgi:superfamily I DNA/RNA helicase
VENWCEKECERLAAKGRDTQAVEDRAACLLELSDGAESVRVVLERIDELFADRVGTDCIVLSSTHKAKGLERDRVWMLVGTYMRRPGVEEENIFYVGCTRARLSLFLVEGFEKKRWRGTSDDPEAHPYNGLSPVDEVLS